MTCWWKLATAIWGDRKLLIEEIEKLSHSLEMARGHQQMSDHRISGMRHQIKNRMLELADVKNNNRHLRTNLNRVKEELETVKIERILLSQRCDEYRSHMESIR